MNMKKTFVSPTMETVKIKAQMQLLAGSSLSYGSDQDPANADSRELDDLLNALGE